MRLYNRQKLLLTLLDAAGGELGAVDFQKLLFLYSATKEAVPSYQFIPHRYGCYSFQAAYDREVLIKKGCLIPEQSAWKISPKAKPFLLDKVRPSLRYFATQLVPQRGKALVTHVYREFPFYAIRSEILDEVFPRGAERKAIEQARTEIQSPALLTIGYEGDSIDGYLKRLIRQDVRLLCDVRRNPLSRKTGFSKKSLTSYCEKVGITYFHLPELGIPGHRRRELNTPEDYRVLFEEYAREDLPQASDALNKLKELMGIYKRVALTCFEKEHTECHRHCVVEELQRQMNPGPVVLHI